MNIRLQNPNPLAAGRSLFSAYNNRKESRAGSRRQKESIMQRTTVVIPNFNGIGFIGKCLESLLAQDIPSSEYRIIVLSPGRRPSPGHSICPLHRPSHPACPTCACEAGTPYVILLNNDKWASSKRQIRFRMLFL